MLPNSFLDQTLDQNLDQALEPEPLVLVAWEQDGRTALADPTARPSRRLLPGLYDVAVTLLILTSLAAIVVCFMRM